MAALLHVNANAKANIIGQELTPQPLLLAGALCRRCRCACADRRRRRPHFVWHGRRHRVAAGAAAGSAAAAVAAAGAWADDAVIAGDMVALDFAHADAGDEEAPVGRDVGAGGVDGDVAGPAQQRAVLEAEEVARLVLAATPTSGRSSRRNQQQHQIHVVNLCSKFVTFYRAQIYLW